MPDRDSRYSFYIITNSNRTALYCGVTNNLEQRLRWSILCVRERQIHSAAGVIVIG
ncbi:MAG: GIY-YIG nuclease family protein [Flavitalea sp.]